MRYLTFIAACILLIGCNVSSKNDALKGLVVDATMNTVTITTTDNDTLSFNTINADKTNLKGLLIGDSIEIHFIGKYELGMATQSLITVAKRSEDGYIRFFKEGIRVEAVNGELRSIYICFTNDSLRAELFTPENGSKEVLEQRTLPSGEHVWNVEDDDTKNLRHIDNCWSVSQRGDLLFKQSQSDNDSKLGAWEEVRYEGILPAADCPGIKYHLSIRHREHSGDGHFLLRKTYLKAENGKDAVYTYVGKRNTQRGNPANPDAIIWQLISDNNEGIYNFLYDAEKQTLTMLNSQFETIDSKLNYTLRKAE